MIKWIKNADDTGWTKIDKGRILDIIPKGDDYIIRDVTGTTPKVIGCEDNPNKAMTEGNEYLRKIHRNRKRAIWQTI